MTAINSFAPGEICSAATSMATLSPYSWGKPWVLAVLYGYGDIVPTVYLTE